MSKQFYILIIFSIFSLFSFSNSLISNYVPIIGGDLITPADITRASLLTYEDQASAMIFAKSIQLENPSDVFNVTFSKYYLNNIISLSNNNSFGALSHYNNLVSLYNNVSNLALVGLNNSVGYINTLSKFTNLDTSKFQTITTSINNYMTSINSIQQVANQQATSINNTKNSLSTNTATLQIVRDNYDLVIKSVKSISNRLEYLKTPLTDIASLMINFENEVNFYVQFLTTDNEYQNTMNSLMKNILLDCNTFYSRSLLLTRLKDFF